MTNLQEIYVPLLDEGVNVWRPTKAEQLPDGTYRVLATPDYDPDDEKWEFPPGTKVIGEMRNLSAGRVLVAARAAQAGRRTA